MWPRSRRSKRLSFLRSEVSMIKIPSPVQFSLSAFGWCALTEQTMVQKLRFACYAQRWSSETSLTRTVVSTASTKSNPCLLKMLCEGKEKNCMI